eukprot:scaffold310605_cov36-Tisochrysis_lutea.AAC.1
MAFSFVEGPYRSFDVHPRRRRTLLDRSWASAWPRNLSPMPHGRSVSPMRRMRQRACREGASFAMFVTCEGHLLLVVVRVQSSVFETVIGVLIALSA